MTWRKIIKESRKDKDETIFSHKEGGQDPRRIKLVGGSDKDKFGRIKDVEEDTLDYVDEDYENMLADSTHLQLMNAFEEQLNELTKEELIKILVKTQGIIKLDDFKLKGE
jgi:hypothetical protein